MTNHSDTLGPISEFSHMWGWWPMLLDHNSNRFRPFPVKSNDSNWIRSPKSMFLQFFRFFQCQRESKQSKNKSKNFIAFSCLEWFAKKNEKYFFRKFWKFHRIFGPFGPFWTNTNFPKNSDSATFYPLYPPNFMQKNHWKRLSGS